MTSNHELSPRYDSPNRWRSMRESSLGRFLVDPGSRLDELRSDLAGSVGAEIWRAW